MVNYVELYTGLREEIKEKLSKQIANFEFCSAIEEWKKIKRYTFQFHKDLRKKIDQLYENSIPEYEDNLKRAKELIRQEILDYFAKRKTNEQPYFDNVIEFKNIAELSCENILFGEIKTNKGYLSQQFVSAKKFGKFEHDNYQNFFDDILKKLDKDKEIINVRKKREEIIKSIGHTEKIFDKYLKIGILDRIPPNWFQIILSVLTIIGVIAGGFIGAYTQYWLTTPRSPELYVSGGFWDDKLHIDLYNSVDKVAKNIELYYSPYPDGNREDWINFESISLMSKRELPITEGLFLTPLGNIIEKREQKQTSEDKEWGHLLVLYLFIECENCKKEPFIADKRIVTSEMLLCKKAKDSAGLECRLSP